MYRNLSSDFKNPQLSRGVLDKIKQELKQPLKFMEVCGTHTVSIFQSGLPSLLPQEIIHISGPGCPVCVTHARDIENCFLLARQQGVIVATFGDLMRVPGLEGQSLKSIQAQGANIKVCYSPFEALKLAQNNPEYKVVFLGIGFETTAPAVAATLKTAREKAIRNFSVFSCHKLIPPALRFLMNQKDLRVQALILPGHVSTVIGLAPYAFLAEEYAVPAVITGFEPLDILQALYVIMQQVKSKEIAVANAYKRAVKPDGNPKARQIMQEVFEPAASLWRGLGSIEESGLKIAEDYAEFDAWQLFDLSSDELPDPPGCRCGDVLCGRITPDQCPLFNKKCTPSSPVGPCMVSTEGSCAAYYKYRF